MRRIVLILAVVMVAAPAWAGITVSAEQVGDTNEIAIWYQMDPGDANLPRAFALDTRLLVLRMIFIVNSMFIPVLFKSPAAKLPIMAAR